MKAKHPMYFIGLSVCAYMGWKQMTEALDTWENSLYTLPDSEGDALPGPDDSWTDHFSHDVRTDARAEIRPYTPAYLNPKHWVLDKEEY